MQELQITGHDPEDGPMVPKSYDLAFHEMDLFVHIWKRIMCAELYD